MSYSKLKNSSSLFLLLGLGFLIGAEGSSGNLSGRVIERFTKIPLAQANVIILNTGLGGAADNQGKYLIKDIPTGEYAVEASMIGYKSIIKTRVKILANRTVNLDFELEPTHIEMPQVMVKPDYFPKPTQTTSSAKLDYHEVRTDPEGYNLPRMLSSLPGVATAEDYAGTIIVRGGSPDENLTILDGVEVANPVHFPEMGSGEGGFSIVNTDLVRDITFSSGGFSAKYSNRLSSFLDIELRDGNREKFEALFDLSMVGVGLILEGPFLRKGTYILSYRRSFLEILDKVTDIGDVIPKYDNYSIRFTYEPGLKDKFSILTLFTKDYLKVPKGSSRLHNDLIWRGGMKIFGLNWRRLFGNSAFFLTNLSFNSTKNRIAAQDELEFRPDEEYFILRTDLNYRPVKWLTIETGGQIGYWLLSESIFIAPFRIGTGDSFPLVDELNDTTTFRFGTYLQAELKPLSFLTIIPGIRYDYLTLNRKSGIAPRLNLSFPLTEKTRLNFATGYFYQAPNYFTLMAKPELNFKKALHYIFGIEHLITPSLRFSLEGYYKRLSQIPVIASNEPNSPFDSIGKGFAKGIELLLHQKLSKNLYGRLSYSLGSSRRKDWQGNYPHNWDQRHILTFIAGWKLTKTMDLSLKYRYASGRPYTPFDTTKKFYDPIGQEWFCPLSVNVNSAYYPAYSRIDLQWANTGTFGPITITGYINIQNLLNRRNVYNYYWDTKEGLIKPNYQFSRIIAGGCQIAF